MLVSMWWFSYCGCWKSTILEAGNLMSPQSALAVCNKCELHVMQQTGLMQCERQRLQNAVVENPQLARRYLRIEHMEYQEQAWPCVSHHFAANQVKLLCIGCHDYFVAAFPLTKHIVLFPEFVTFPNSRSCHLCVFMGLWIVVESWILFSAMCWSQYSCSWL